MNLAGPRRRDPQRGPHRAALHSVEMLRQRRLQAGRYPRHPIFPTLAVSNRQLVPIEVELLDSKLDTLTTRKSIISIDQMVI